MGCREHPFPPRAEPRLDAFALKAVYLIPVFFQIVFTVGHAIISQTGIAVPQLGHFLISLCSTHAASAAGDT